MDPFYQELVDEIEGACESLEVDLRAKRMYTPMLFCAKKVILNMCYIECKEKLSLLTIFGGGGIVFSCGSYQAIYTLT